MKFKIGDIVRVVRCRSTDSKIMYGKTGRISKCFDGGSRHMSYYELDNEEYICFISRGLWEDELVLAEAVKKIVKEYNISLFMKGQL